MIQISILLKLYIALKESGIIQISYFIECHIT